MHTSIILKWKKNKTLEMKPNTSPELPNWDSSSCQMTFQHYGDHLFNFNTCSFKILMYSFKYFREMIKRIKLINLHDIYLCKVKIKNTRRMCEICSNIWIKTRERCQWRCSGVFIVNFEQISHIVVALL